ncbi:hypothetical protein [Pseudomonas chlororaphis]|jgi:hypothetical protein|uniref:hypothetical protein n=1 Tax=Pseudomonas chlororaphis TaxID=587753 RepID=UPI002408137E|nr:hypothetical protein [Pseudomonas chlororaphis]
MEDMFKYLVPALLALIAWWLKVVREHDTVGRALYAEIEALVQIVVGRRYLEDMEEAANKLCFKSAFSQEPEYVRVPIKDSYCRVYAGNIQNLGCLKDEEAGLVVRFYQFADSFVRDVTEGGNLYQGTNDHTAFEEAVAILKEALSAYESLKALRERRASMNWFRRYLEAIV